MPTMKSCARAPVRVDPAGGGTDAPPFRVDHGGAVINMAVKRYAFATAERLPAGQGIRIAAEDIGEGVRAESVAALRAETDLDFLRAFVDRLVDPDDSISLTTRVDVPPGSGLGGSGALGVAVTAALDGLYDRARTAFDTARIANEIERQDLGYPGGDQDSFGAALGGVNFLAYEVGGALTPHKVSLSEPTRQALEDRSLLVYTGAAHVSGNIHDDILAAYADEGSSTKQAMFALQAGAEAMRVDLERGDVEAYGRGLSNSCRHLYQLHESCDSDELRRYIGAMQEHLVGAKTCGAGGGGFIKVLTRPGHQDACRATAEALGGEVWPFAIDFEGLVRWQH